MVEHTHEFGFIALFVVGLLGAGHCASMCGGIITALSFASHGSKRPLLIVAYNIGRISSYAIAGSLVGVLSYWGAAYLALGPWLRIIAGVLVIAMGFYIANWLNWLMYLEKVGAYVWRFIQPLGKGLLPPTTLGQATALGLIWGWLPCGLVYSALAYAAMTESPLYAASSMIAFGLGTAPAMLLGGFFSEQLKPYLQNSVLRQVMGIVLIAFGVWTISSALQHEHKHHGAAHHSNDVVSVHIEYQ